MPSLPDLWLLLLLVIPGFIASRALSGIIGEYAKRLWFGSLEPRVSRFIAALPAAKRKATMAKLAQKLDELEKANTDLQKRAEALFVERDELTAEVIRLRLELMDLRNQRRAS